MTSKWATKGGLSTNQIFFRYPISLVEPRYSPQNIMQRPQPWDLVSCFEKIPCLKVNIALENRPSQKGKVVSQPPFCRGYVSKRPCIGTGSIFRRSAAETRREAARHLSRDWVMWKNGTCDLMSFEEWWGAWGCNMLHLHRRCLCLGWAHSANGQPF